MVAVYWTVIATSAVHTNLFHLIRYKSSITDDKNQVTVNWKWNFFLMFDLKVPLKNSQQIKNNFDQLALLDFWKIFTH